MSQREDEINLFLIVFLGSLFEKSSAKTFILKGFSAHSGLDRDVRTNQSVKVLVKLFQKLVGS